MLVGSATSIGCNDKRWQMTIAKAQALQRLHFPEESMNKKIWKENSFLISNDLSMKTRPYFFFEWPFIHCGREVISYYKSHLLWRQKGSIFLWPHIMFSWYKKAWHSIDFESITISHLTSPILVPLKICWNTYCLLQHVANFDIESILKSFGIMFIVVLVNLLDNLIGWKEKTTIYS